MNNSVPLPFGGAGNLQPRLGPLSFTLRQRKRVSRLSEPLRPFCIGDSIRLFRHDHCGSIQGWSVEEGEQASRIVAYQQRPYKGRRAKSLVDQSFVFNSLDEANSDLLRLITQVMKIKVLCRLCRSCTIRGTEMLFTTVPGSQTRRFELYRSP